MAASYVLLGAGRPWQSEDVVLLSHKHVSLPFGLEWVVEVKTRPPSVVHNSLRQTVETSQMNYATLQGH